VRITSNDPFAAPRIQPNYLAADRDCGILLGGIKFVRRLFAAKPIAQYIASETWPGPAVASDDELIDFARTTGSTVYHPVGTCRMGASADAPVDPSLRVRGLNSLRVIDASVMPTMVSGNTYAATIMIAEKGAQMISGIIRALSYPDRRLEARLLLLLKLTLSPLLIIVVTLATRRWGMAMGGWLASLPINAGPILLFYALEQGTSFAASAAHFTISSVVGVATSCLAYGWIAQKYHWPICLLGAWAAFFATVALLRLFPMTLVPALVVSIVVLFVARKLLPAVGPIAVPSIRPRFDLPMRIAATLALILSLTYLAGWLGPRLSGLLTAFPVASAVVGAFSHAQQGRDAAVSFFRGMLGGMHGFCVFCAVLSLTLQRYGVPAAFALALSAQVVIHGLSLWLRQRQSRIARLTFL
jgi:GMC oxidoreductase